GVDRILFGSDYPLLAPEKAVAEVHALGFDPSEERSIFHDNAAALFGLPSEPPCAAASETGCSARPEP
ncbi:MAG: Amidohydrolase, partial [Pseudomonadota bacterium]